MADCSRVKTERADIIILHAAEAWTNYNAAIAVWRWHMRFREFNHAERLEAAARLSLETYFEKIEEKVAAGGW